MKHPTDPIARGQWCPHCDCPTELRPGSPPRRVCPRCGASVRCYPASDRAMGSVAPPAVRRLRKEAHRWFDAIWRHRLKRSRYNAYSWLSLRLGISKDLAHIGMADAETCRRIIDICQQYIRRKDPDLFISMTSAEKQPRDGNENSSGGVSKL